MAVLLGFLNPPDGNNSTRRGSIYAFRLLMPLRFLPLQPTNLRIRFLRQKADAGDARAAIRCGRDRCGPHRRRPRSTGLARLRNQPRRRRQQSRLRDAAWKLRLIFGRLSSGEPAMSPEPAGRAAKARPWAGGPEIGVASVAAARLDGRRRRRRFAPVGRQAVHVIGHRR